MDSPDEAQQKPPPRRTRSRVESIPREEWERMLVGDHTPIVRSTAAPHPPKLSRRVSSQQQIEPPQTTSVALPSVDLRKAALTHRLSSQGSLRNSSDSGHVSSASDGLEPPLAIALNPRTINEDERDILDVEAERESVQGSTSTGSGRSKRDVIVTSQHSRGSVASPTPLGCPRRQSLFERAHGASMAEFAIATGAPQDDWGGSEHNNNDTVAQRGKYIDPLKLEDGEPPQDEDPPPVEGHGQYHTVLRDWLMHVVEKDDNLDTEKVQNVWAVARRRRRLENKTFEAADYELYDSKVWHNHKDASVRMNRNKTKNLMRQRKEIGRWITIGLGVAVGLTGCFVTFFTEWIVHAKLHFIAHIIELHEDETDLKRYGAAFGWLWFINSCLTAAAFGMVWFKPWSNGSGIPETKCVLNGVSIPQVVAPSTLVSKVFGVILGVSSGLPIGKEGPMIHAGAAIGASIASLPRIKCLEEFRNDRDRRDLAAMGTAAGVAAAFHTPIGGVLFALEEGASFWSTFLTWRSFAAAVVTVVVYYLVFQGRTMFKEPLGASDIFLFGEFQDSESSFYMWELPMFALIATLGGLLGAGFVGVSKRLALFRARYLAGARRRFAEIMTISTVMTTVAFFLPLAVGECRAVPTDLDGWSPAGIASVERLVTLNCHHGEYNELATLFLNEQDGMIKLLFHFGDNELRASSVILFCGVFLTLQCVTSGVWVSSGLFIPSILSGASMGRGIGELLGRNSRAYALIGAAGILGGITRMTLSVTVMMVEASGWVLFVIPLMLVFITARAVGNRINEGIYDTQISIKKMPFLKQEPPEETRTQNLRTNQVMSKEVVCLRPIETVEAIMSILRDYDHNCFPVVENSDQRVLLGVVYRKNLSVLLKLRHFTAPSLVDPTRPDDSLPELSWRTLEESYPRYPKFSELRIGEEDMGCLMDIAAYVQIGPHAINEYASAHRAYIMFRTLGLRHLVVVNHYNEVTGIITRENLLSEHFEHGGVYRTRSLGKFSAA